MGEAKVVKVSASERIRDLGGGTVVPGGIYATPPQSEMPERVIYTCPNCQMRHPLSLKEIGNALWTHAPLAPTDYPELDAAAEERGWDLECECGLVARVHGAFGDWGKMGPIYFGPTHIFERWP